MVGLRSVLTVPCAAEAQPLGNIWRNGVVDWKNVATDRPRAEQSRGR
jgi:hypothetical protein